KGEQRYDLILDNVGNRSFLECRRVLTPQGKYVLIGGGGLDDGRWIGTLARPLKALVLTPFVKQEMGMMLAEINNKDLTTLADLMQTGKVKPVIDRSYPLSQIREAMRYLEEGHARGKVVINLDRNKEAAPANGNLATSSSTTMRSYSIALALIGIILGVSIVPIVLAVLFDRRFRRVHPGARPFRWGYYFSLAMLIAGILLSILLE